jgi:hypothetical protein
MFRAALAIVGVIVVVVGVAAARLGLSYYLMPVSKLGVGYVVGARVALTSDNVHAIAGHESPTIEFRRRSEDMANKYTWQPSKLERPASCLYYEPNPETGQIGHPKSCPTAHRVIPSGMRFYFSIEPGGAVRLGASDKPLRNTDHVTDGALYEADGEIGIGTSLDDAAWFKFTLDAEWLTVLDPPKPSNAASDPDWMDNKCAPASYVRLRDPLILALLPPRAARICPVEPEKPERKRRLFLVHFQSGLLQWADWTNRLGCRALLKRLMPSPPPAPGDVAGCIGGPWAEFNRTDLYLAFFEVLPHRELAAIR